MPVPHHSSFYRLVALYIALQEHQLNSRRFPVFPEATSNSRRFPHRVILYIVLLHPFNGLFSRTTWISRYQKGKTSLDLSEARDGRVLGCSGTSWTRAGFKRGQTGQLPRASATKGPPQKTVKKLLPKET